MIYEVLCGPGIVGFVVLVSVVEELLGVVECVGAGLAAVVKYPRFCS